MLKKCLIAAGGTAALGGLLFGSDAISYVGTSASRVKESVQNRVPVEFEIDRARKMVKDLVPDIRRNMHTIAKQEVDAERLEQEIAQRQSQLDKDKADVMQLRAYLDQSKSVYRISGRRYSSEQVKLDLANRFERFKTSDATLKSLQDIHEARLRGLTAARQKLDEMRAKKAQLEVDVENLEARLKMVEVAQTASNYQFDDSQLARVMKHMDHIRTRLAVAEKLVNADVPYEGEIPLAEPAPEDIADQVTEYFELDGAPVEHVAEVSSN